MDNVLPISGFPGYEVSDTGKVFSYRTNAGKVGMTRRMMRPFFNHGGYPRVTLRHNGRVRLAFIHQLVLETFIGPCPLGMRCRHKDGIAANCALSNLEWATMVVNASDKVRHGTLYCGERHHSAKLSVDQVRRIRSLHASGVSIGELSKAFGVCRGPVHSIVTGKTWRYV